MIKVLDEGEYRLIETKNQTKILFLDTDKVFAWIYVRNVGEILVTSHKPHRADSVVATGKYRLYQVKDEPKITDLIHLELLVGSGKWQGYILPNGLPDDADKRNRIIATTECITKSFY